MTEELYEEIITVFLKNPRVSLPQNAKGFGSKGLWTRGRMFAFLTSKKKLAIKLPKARVDGLVESGKGERLDPGHGRPMKEWFFLNSYVKTEWLTLAGESLEYVSQLSVKNEASAKMKRKIKSSSRKTSLN
jgi:TfoX/Sxy family transcriptional regulator of competence genes